MILNRFNLYNRFQNFLCDHLQSQLWTLTSHTTVGDIVRRFSLCLLVFSFESVYGNLLLTTVTGVGDLCFTDQSETKVLILGETAPHPYNLVYKRYLRLSFSTLLLLSLIILLKTVYPPNPSLKRGSVGAEEEYLLRILYLRLRDWSGARSTSKVFWRVFVVETTGVGSTGRVLFTNSRTRCKNLPSLY